MKREINAALVLTIGCTVLYAAFVGVALSLTTEGCIVTWELPFTGRVIEPPDWVLYVTGIVGLLERFGLPALWVAVATMDFAAIGRSCGLYDTPPSCYHSHPLR